MYVNAEIDRCAAEYGLFRILEDMNMNIDGGDDAWNKRAKWSQLIDIHDAWFRVMSALVKPANQRAGYIGLIEQDARRAVADPELAQLARENIDMSAPALTYTDAALLALEIVSRSSHWKAFEGAEPLTFARDETGHIVDRDYNTYLSDFDNHLRGETTTTVESKSGNWRPAVKSNVVPISPLYGQFRDREMFWAAECQPVYAHFPMVDRRTGRALHPSEDFNATVMRIGQELTRAANNPNACKNIGVSIYEKADGIFRHVGMSGDRFVDNAYGHHSLGCLSDATGMSTLRWYVNNDNEWMSCNKSVNEAWTAWHENLKNQPDIPREVIEADFNTHLAQSRAAVLDTAVPICEYMTSTLRPFRLVLDAKPGQVRMALKEEKVKVRLLETPEANEEMRARFVGKPMVDDAREYTFTIMDQNGESVDNGNSPGSYKEPWRLITSEDRLSLVKFALGDPIDGIRESDVEKMVSLVQPTDLPKQSNYKDMVENLRTITNEQAARTGFSANKHKSKLITRHRQTAIDSTTQLPLRLSPNRTQYQTKNGEVKTRYGEIIAAKVRDTRRDVYPYRRAKALVNGESRHVTEVRRAITSARKNLVEIVNLDEMIDLANAYITGGPDKRSLETPDFSRDNGIDNKAVNDLREQLWRVLIGEHDNIIMPFDDLTEPEKSMGGVKFHVDGVNPVDTVTHFDVRVEGAKKALDAFVNRYIGTFEPTTENSPDMGGAGPYARTFNPGHVIEFMPGLGIGSKQDFFVTAVRMANETADTPVIDVTLMRGDNSDDTYANRLRDSLTPFKASGAVSLAQLNERVERGETLDAVDAYKREILSTVHEAGSPYFVNLDPAQVKIDESGLVMYTGHRRSGNSVVYGKDYEFTTKKNKNGEVEEPKKPVQSDPDPVTGYIGRFALPSSQKSIGVNFGKNAEADDLSETILNEILVMNPPYSDPYVIYPPVRADILPSSLTNGHNTLAGVNGDRIDRTRGLSFTEHLKRAIRQQVSNDLMSNMFSGDYAGAFDSIRGAYKSDYTGPHFDFYAFVEHELLVADKYYQATEGDYDMQAVNRAQTLDIVRTRNASVRYNDAFYDASVISEINRNKQGADVADDISHAMNDRTRDAFTRADRRSMGVQNAHERALFDALVTSDSKDQARKRALNQGAKLSLTEPPVMGDGRGAAIHNMAMFDHTQHDAWNRGRMATANIDHAVRVTTANVLMCSGGGWTQDDCMVVTTDFANANEITGKDGRLRPLRVGDKISDAHGNKGVISAVVDPYMSREDAYRIENGYTDENGRTYPPRLGYANLVKLFANNLDDNGVCKIEVMMNAVSSISRMNAGTLKEARDSRINSFDGKNMLVREIGDYTDLSGKVHENCICKLNIIMHDKAVDKQTNFDNNSNIGWQLAAALEDCPAILEEIFGRNNRSLIGVREALRTSIGADIDEYGTLHNGLVDQKDEKRALIDIPYANDNDELIYNDEGEMIDSKPRPNYVSTLEGLGEVPTDEYGMYLHNSWQPMGTATEATIAATTNTIMDVISNQGGFIPVPFELKWPEHSVPVSALTDAEAKAFGVAKSDKAQREIKLGGGRLDKSTVRGITGNTMYDLPIESITSRQSTQGAGDKVMHDDSRCYRDIISLSVKYNNESVYKQAYTDEIKRLSEGLASNTLSENDQVATYGSRKTCTVTKAIDSYKIKIADIDKKLKNLEASAQSKFNELANNVWDRNFCGSDNHIKRRLMRCEIPSSTHCVWSGDPTCPIDTVRVGIEQAEKLGVKNKDMVALWRSPVLLPTNICGLHVEIDPNIDGVAVNPALARRIGGDFDGDKVSLWAPKNKESMAELVSKLTLEAGIINDRTQPTGFEWDGMENGDTFNANNVTADKMFTLEVNDGLDARIGALKLQREAVESGELMEMIGTPLMRIESAKAHLCELSAGLVQVGSEEERKLASHMYVSELDDNIRAAQAASLGETPIEFTNDTTIIQSVMDATINPGVKGKPKAAQNLMRYYGMVPNDVEAIEACKTDAELYNWLTTHPVELECETVDRVNIPDITDENGKITWKGLQEKASRYTLNPDAYISIETVPGMDSILGNTLDMLSDEAADRLRRVWHQWKDDVDESTMRAMECKSNVTGMVGVFSQLWMKAFPDDKELACKLGQPIYQWSLDLKLDGEAAREQVPWVDVCRNVMCGKCYTELCSCDPSTSFAGIHPSTLELDTKTLMSKESWVNSMMTIMTQLGQDVNIELYQQAAEKLADKDGLIRGIEDVTIERGSTLERTAFDSSPTGIEMLKAVYGERSLYESDTMCYAPIKIRAANNCEIMNKHTREKNEGKVATIAPKDVRVDNDLFAHQNLRGLDAAIAAGNVRMVVVHPESMSDEEMYRNELYVTDKLGCTNGCEIKSASSYASLEQAIGAADVVFMTDKTKYDEVYPAAEKLSTRIIYADPKADGFKLMQNSFDKTYLQRKAAERPTAASVKAEMAKKAAPAAPAIKMPANTSAEEAAKTAAANPTSPIIPKYQPPVSDTSMSYPGA